MNNPDPWNKQVPNDQYKFYSVSECNLQQTEERRAGLLNDMFHIKQ